MVSTLKLNRRSLLGLATGAGAAAVGGSILSGCSGSGGTSAESGKIVMVTVTEKGEVDSDAFYKEQLAKFTDKTGIEVELRTYPFDQYANSVQLLFSQGSPPDVFRSAGTAIQHPFSYVRGWEHPLTQYISDEWKQTWPEGSLNPKISGLHVGDDLYATPFVTNGACHELYCNIELLNKYGVQEPPKTWSEFEEAALKVSKDSKGKVHGFYPLTGTMVSELQYTSGPPLTGLGPAGVNLLTGKSDTAGDGTVAMIEMLQRLNAGGAFIPGWQSEQAQNSEQMWTAFSQDKVAMSMGSSWNYREMLNLRPDLPLVMATAPVPDSGRAGYTPQSYVFLPFWHMGAKTQQPKSACKLVEFLSSPDVMLAYYKIAKRNPPALPKSEFSELLDKWDERMFEIRDETVRLGPSPTMHSVDAAEVQASIEAAQPKPEFDEMELLAITRGQSKYDYATRAKQFDGKYQQAIDKQIADATKKDLDVSADTYVFTDWDPMQDYTPEGVERPKWH